jgi:microcompartment protein CcmL/EutN
VAGALGFFEVQGVVAAVDALDIMVKTADVRFLTWERKLGGRLATVVVVGGVSAVTEAVEAARERCIRPPAAWAVVANPHPEIARIVAISAARLEAGNQDRKYLQES